MGIPISGFFFAYILIDNMPEQQEQAISWTVLTHEHKDRSADWYWTLGALAVVGIGLSIFFSNILLAIILAVGAGSIGFLAARGPREHMVRIDKRGVSLDGTLYPYPSIHSFWVEESAENPRLFLSTSGFLSPSITVPLDNASHAQSVRDFLKKFGEEEEQRPHFGEHLAEMLGL